MASTRVPRKPVHSTVNKLATTDISEYPLTDHGMSYPSPQYPQVGEKTGFLTGQDSLSANIHPSYHRSFESSPNKATPWQPGTACNVPFMGIGAIILVILCLAGCIVVLMISDGQLVSSWRVQPTVLLAIFSTVANSALAFALAEGLNISWWNKALKGSTLKDLHQRWQFGTSIWASLTRFWVLDIVAFASIMATLMLVDGPLLQRASSVVSRQVDGLISIDANIAPEIPQGYTAHISGRDGYPDRLHSPFVQVLQSYINRSPIISGLDGCIGACKVDVPAAGLAASCTSYEVPINYGENILGTGSGPIGAGPVGSGGTVNASAFNTYPAFAVNFRWASALLADPLRKTDATPSYITMNVSFANTTSCSGVMITKTCNLTSAVVIYHVALTSKNISLEAPLTNLTVLAVANNTAPNEHYGDDSTLGGIAIAATDLFSANVSLRFAGTLGFQPFGLNTFSSIYAGGDVGVGSCDYNWKDPSDDILASLNNILFRTALSIAANESSIAPDSTENNFPTKQKLQGTAIGAQNVFMTHYPFLAASVGVMALGILSVLPTFHQFWRLGRPVTLSPLEIAKAFDAPLLRGGGGGNGEAEAIVKVDGGKRVRYRLLEPGENRGRVEELMMTEDSQLL